MVSLRDYQQELYDKIKLAFKNGYKNPLAVLPCRSGKSYIMKVITQAANQKGNKVLILAHRNQLLNQHRELFEDIDKKLTRIENVFTEVRHLGEHGQVDLIIIDECHLSGADSYKKICDYYKCPRIGFTATAGRLDGKPLTLFDTIVEGITADELIERGLISKYNYYAPDLNIDLSRVKKVAGDYNNQELGEAVSGKRIYGDVLKYYKKIADGKQGIAYCVNVKHSKEICEMFNNNGISAVHMDSHTPEKEREKILKDFKEKKFTILCNCNLISEGITLPSADVCLMLRPTLSLCLFIQQACRCLTPNEDKTAIIIDYVNNYSRHGLPTQHRKWSLKQKVKDYINENDDGTLKLRVCQECFGTFETAPVCPYCGAVYETTPVEIQNFKEIELKKIEEKRAAQQQRYRETIQSKVEKYTKPQECKSWFELVQYCKVKGYKTGYAFVLNKQLKLNFKIGGK